jgi:cytochrome c556
MLLLSGMVLSFSCKKEAKEEPKPQPPAPAQPQGQMSQAPAVMPGKIIPPEKFFQFQIDWLTLIKSHKQKFLDLVKATKTKSPAFIDKVKEADAGIRQDIEQLLKKNNVDAQDLNKTGADQDAAKANQEYMEKHTEVRGKLEQLNNDIGKINQATKTEIDRLKLTPEDISGKPPAQAPAPQETPAPSAPSAPQGGK